MDKAPIGYQPGKRYVGGRHQFMDELPKKNPKYEGVKGKLDTGPTVKKMPVFSTPG